MFYQLTPAQSHVIRDLVNDEMLRRYDSYTAAAAALKGDFESDFFKQLAFDRYRHLDDYYKVLTEILQIVGD